MTDTVTRAIYNKAIFHREKQMDRKVYDRARNVLPVNPEPTPVEDKYAITSATATGTMSGYETNETITILGAEGDTSAVLTIMAEDGAITALTVTNAGEYAEDISGEVSTYTYVGEGEGAVITVVASKISE